MRSHSRTLRLSTVAVALAAGALQAAPQARPIPTPEAAARLLESRRPALGLDADHSFQALRREVVEGHAHTRVQQLYRGIPVWGGQGILRHDPQGKELAPVTYFKRDIHLNPLPSLSAAEALATAHTELAPKGAYAHDPQARLVIYPVTVDVDTREGLRPAGEEPCAADFRRDVVRYELAYHVHAELENAQDGVVSRDLLVQAHTGAILKSWSTLHTIGPVKATGNSQFSGTVTLDTMDLGGSLFAMFDSTRGHDGKYGGNATINFKNGYDGDGVTGDGSLYTDTNNIWGNGLNYLTAGNPKPATNGTTGQTAAVDAHFGLQATWDFYKRVLGRNGIDGDGTATFNRVHYLPPDQNGVIPFGYKNAFWQDSCFCMSYGDGDGSSWNTVTALDVAGHEMSHGVCSSVAGLNYYGEAGGLNESNSDIFGTMVETYTRQGVADARIRNIGGTWTIGEQVLMNGSALRWMYKPSFDGKSPDAWYSGIGTDPKLATTNSPSGGDPHFVSGPLNRWFYFLSQGSSPINTDATHSKYLGTDIGSLGIGNDKAARIWYVTLSLLDSDATYAEAMNAAVIAAQLVDPLNPDTAEAVRAAATAINVYHTFSGTTMKWASGTNTNLLAPDPIPSGGAVMAGRLYGALDNHYYSVRIPAGATAKATLIPATDCTYYLFVYDANGTMVGHSMNTLGDFQTSTLKNSGTSTATFYYRVYPAVLGSRSPRSYYTLDVKL